MATDERTIGFDNHQSAFQRGVTQSRLDVSYRLVRASQPDRRSLRQRMSNRYKFQPGSVNQ
jgi:hypothetical protein